MTRHRVSKVRRSALAAPVGVCLLGLYVVLGAQSGVPKYRFDPDWPKPLPNKWKIGGITGLAVGQGRQRLGVEPSERPH